MSTGQVQGSNLFSRLIYDTKLKYKLIIFFSMAMIIPLILLGLYYNFTMENSILESEKKTLTQRAYQLNNTLDMFLDTYLSGSSMLFNNTEIQQAIVSKPQNLAGIIQTRKDIVKILSSVNNLIRFPEIRDSDYARGETVVELYIFNETIGRYGGDISDFNQIENELWCRLLYQSNVTVVWQPNIKYNNISYIALNRRLVNFKTGEDIGVLRIYIPSERLQKIIEKSLSNSEDMILYYSVQDMIPVAAAGMTGHEEEVIKKAMSIESESSIANVNILKKSYLLKKLISETNGWTLDFFASTQDITMTSRKVTLSMIMTVLLSLVLCIGSSALLATFITRRLNVLVAKTNQIGENSLVADLHLQGEDEIGQIDKNFNGMLNRINDLIEKEYKLTLKVNQTRFELLQEQINPHLLYNTLSMISLIARQSGETAILDVCNNLIGFYKGILSSGKLTTSIGDEISMIKMYVKIMKFVYKIKTDLILDIDEEILSLYTLKLILQPLVENAIIHGLRPAGGGILIISGNRINDRIFFEISDSGVGIPDDIKSCISSSLRGEIKEQGFGISNVANRIKLFFGYDYHMILDSDVGQGTKIRLSVPVLNSDQINEFFDDLI